RAVGVVLREVALQRVERLVGPGEVGCLCHHRSVPEGVANISRGRPRSAVRSGLVTGLSLASISGTAAAVAAILAQKFGHTAETDGFFAAYGVYLVLVLAAQSIRLVVLPDLTRAVPAGRLSGETRAYMLTVTALGL